jgi:hypothetical protein
MIQGLAASNLKFIKPQHLPQLATDTFDAAVAIEKLKKVIKDSVKLDTNLRKNLQFKAYQELLCSSRSACLRGTVHCEIGLLLKVLLGLDLDKRSTLMFNLAVSKLCCPVCKEFMEVLVQETGIECRIFGYHSTLSPVALPRSLPRNLLERMVERFRGHVRYQLINMTTQSSLPSKHTRNSSWQSDSGLSIASSNPNDDEPGRINVFDVLFDD